MKKNKFIKISMLFFGLALLIFIFSNHFIVKAEDEGIYKGSKELENFAKLEWNNVKDLKMQELVLDASKNGDYTVDNSTCYGYRNLMCFHGESYKKPNGVASDINNYLRLRAIVDIDSDGKVYISYRNIKGDIVDGKEITGTNSIYTKKLAAFASEITKNYKGDERRLEVSGQSIWNTYRSDFWHLMSLSGLTSSIASDVPTFGCGTEYYNTWCTPECNHEFDKTKVYSARMFIFYSIVDFPNGGQGIQDRAIIFGTEEDAENVSINKYITKVDYLGPFKGTSNSYTREKMPETNQTNKDGTTVIGKNSKPVVVTHGNVKVHYTITVTNNSSAQVKGKLTDIFDKDFFKNLSSDNDNSFTISDGKIKINNDENITIEGKKSKSFKITLTGDYGTIAGTHKNTAKFITKKKTYESSDYVKVDPVENVKIVKFIDYVDDLQNNYKSADIDLTGKGKSREEWKEDDKKSKAVETAHGNVKVRYKIKVTNNGTIPLNGTLTDTYDGKFLSNLSGLTNGKIEKLEVGKTATFTITLDGNPNITNSNGEIYINTAKFKSSWGSKKEYTSSDWIKVVPKGQTIDKTIAKINETKYSRERMTEEEKEKNVVDAGTNAEKKTIVYKITINNRNKEDITGKFYDEADKGIIINKIVDEKGSEITNGGTLKIKKSTTITVTTTVEAKTLPGIYRNTSRFIVDGTRREIESSDYFELKPVEEPPTGTLKKYITGIESANDRENSTSTVFDNVYKENRNQQNYDWKYEHPVEVEQGDIVTYRVDLTFKINDPNLSAYDDKGNLCPDHYNKRIITSLTCEDTFFSNCLEFIPDMSDKNVTYESYRDKVLIKWTNINVDDISKEQTVSAELKFRVKADKLVCVNIENKVQNINYEYTKYTCLVNHGNWHEENTANNGYRKWCDHKKCSFTHEEKLVNGQIAGNDGDFVRILDPEIGGRVFLDKNDNGLLDLEDELIGNMPKEQYKKVSVELWRTGERDGKSIDEKVAVKSVDPVTGEYSFGRVKRSPYMIITEDKQLSSKSINYASENKIFNKVGNSPFTKVADIKVTEDTSNNYDYDIGEGNYFYYKDLSDVDDYYNYYYYNNDFYHYYIVFNYDGERYEAVRDAGIDHLSRDTLQMSNLFVQDSNAKEEGREEFNNSLQTISYNRAFPNIDGSGDGKELKYTTNDEKGNPTSNLQVSTALWDGDVDSSINIKAKTSLPTLNNIFEDTEYLKHMNLGLKERTYGDLSLTKDVVSAEVTVNGFKTTYEYGKLGAEDGEFKPASNNTINKPYTLRIYREDYEYRTANQETEIQNILNENNPYTDYGRTNDLEIILTYKITVKNNSDSAMGVVREIVDYSSKDLELLKDTVTMNAPYPSGIPLKVNLGAAEPTSKYKNTIYKGNSYSFNQNFFTGDIGLIRLKPGQELEVYSKYKVAKDSKGYINIDNATVTRGSDGKIILEEVLGETKYNVAEIGAYSLYMNGNTPAGLLDKNSNPGNIGVTDDGFDTEHFEDDTFETGIGVILRDDTGSGGGPGDGNPSGGENPPSGTPKVEKNAYRNISGIVFEEINKKATDNSDKQLVGDGIMKTGEDKPAENVIVKLFEVVQKKTPTGEVEKEYLVDTGLWYRTGNDGRYYFGDKVDGSLDGNKESIDDRYRLHAGTYVVRFVYGDEEDKLETEDGNTIKYSGQDYQSTKYQVVGNLDEEEHIEEATVFTELSGNVTEFDSSGNPTKGSKIYSVAKDNEVRRLEVNQYSTTTTYPMDTILKAKEDTEEMKLLSEHTAMFADTKMFNMQVEYYDNYTNKETKEIDGTLSIENYYYSVRDINFGLIERPKTKLQLMNDISEIRAITSDGQTLIDLFFDVIYQQDGKGGIKHTSIPNMEKSTGLNQVQILNRNGNNQGFRYANIDNDILQGMVITIKFKIAIANNSEVDHISKWLEEKMEEETKVDLESNILRRGSTEAYVNTAGEEDGIIVDYIKQNERKYDYTNSYLYKLLYDGATGIGQDGSGRTESLRSSNTGIYGYKATSGEENKIGSDNIKRAYTYTNIKKVQPDYKLGYYLGNIYYYNTLHDHSIESAEVRTRVDQFVDYVDNDLVFKPEENVNEEKQIKYVTYSLPEIGSQGILKDVYQDTTSLTDGEKDYISSTGKNTNNNLAFNIEDEEINKGMYQFLPSIPEIAYENVTETEMNYNLDGDDRMTSQFSCIGNPYKKEEGYNYEEQIAKYLYVMDLEASKVLTSEIDLEGIVIDNLAEIVKTTNTAGRKVYVKADNGTTGYLGNTTKTPIESVNKDGSTTTLVDIAKTETDTDFTEYVTFSPPTGLTEEQYELKTNIDRITNTLLIIVPLIIIVGGISYVAVQVVRKKKFYK